MIGKALEIPALVAAQLRNGSQQESVVLVKGQTAYVVNSERTMLVRMLLDDTFSSEIRWRAADWEDGTIVATFGGNTTFRSSQTGIARTKTCPAPTLSFVEVDTAWNKSLSDTDGQSGYVLVGSVLKSHLDESLSHVEFWNVDGRLRLKQRDLYGGSLIELDLNLMANTDHKLNIDRISVRTKDFLGLFLVDGLGHKPVFRFGSKSTRVEGNTFMAILGNCVYDDMYTVEEIHGRQESKERQSEQGTDSPVEGTQGNGADGFGF